MSTFVMTAIKIATIAFDMMKMYVQVFRPSLKIWKPRQIVWTIKHTWEASLTCRILFRKILHHTFRQSTVLKTYSFWRLAHKTTATWNRKDQHQYKQEEVFESKPKAVYIGNNCFAIVAVWKYPRVAFFHGEIRHGLVEILIKIFDFAFVVIGVVIFDEILVD